MQNKYIDMNALEFTMEKLLGAYSMKIPKFLEEEYNGALADIEKVIARAYVFEEFVKRIEHYFLDLEKGLRIKIPIPSIIRHHITDIENEINRLYPESDRTWNIQWTEHFLVLSPKK